jgi:hypothetical protein
MYFFEKNIVYVKYNADINKTAGDIGYTYLNVTSQRGE